MKRLYTLLPFLSICASLLLTSPLRAAEGDTTLIPLVSNFNFPGTPTSIDAKVAVPQKSWARVVLKLQLACPCAKGKGEWDYTNTYFIKKPTGAVDTAGKPVYDPIEIARFITPYWGSQPANSNYTWWWDVTDYAYLMQDSTVFSIRYDGYTSSASFNVWLECIEGTPPYSVYGIDKLWQSSFLYGNLKDPIDNHLLNKHFLVDNNAQFTKLKITTTGHGGYGPQVVAEFIDKTHHIAINDTDRFTQHLWRSDCGSNPYYPQDGTWAYARAGWCPGDVVPTWDWDISPYVSHGDSTTLDYKMQPFAVDSACNGIYSVAAQVMYAHKPNFSNDASLEEILAPNVATAKTRYNRMNPICGNPIIRVRNNGSAPMTSLKVEYGVHGQAMQTFTWTGNVMMMNSVDITLPTPDWTSSFADSSRQFDCRILQTNGVDDEYPLFNSLSSTYSVPPSYDGDMQINFRTNLQANNQGYYWELRNSSNEVVATRAAGSLDDQTLYVDSLHLSPGCYTFEFVNPSNIGLAWWATSGQLGSGSLSFTGHGTTIKTFNGDCGNGIYQQFMVGIVPQIKVVDNVQSVSLGPVAIGDSIQSTVQVTPLNSAGLVISDVSIAAIPKGFSLVSTSPSLSGGPVTLQEGQTLSATVQYKPQTAGKKSASLNISSNDMFVPKLIIPLSGWDSSTEVIDDATTVHLQVIPTSTNSSARILFGSEAVRGGSARCAIYDQLGREVRVLFDNAVRPFNSTEINANVSELVPGVYYVVLQNGSISATAPLVITR